MSSLGVILAIKSQFKISQLGLKFSHNEIGTEIRPGQSPPCSSSLSN